ncbi:MAG TPA: PemK family transcriptional regulator [Syntrophomonas sp.]|jgi:mRNA interferase MazF|nr:PemK family transcriptional regulator [Syntrophomonas sp.]HCF69981.1 PemK family transcriptional regulator [Syntrophomonas sp.]
MVEIKRGDIYLAKLDPVIYPEPDTGNPVLIIQNDIANQYAPTTIVAAITSQTSKVKLPTRINLNDKRFGLHKDSVILLEQIRTIDKNLLREKIGSIDEATMQKVSDALMISQGIK